MFKTFQPKIKTPKREQQTGVDLMFDCPLIKMSGFLGDPEIFRKELWALINNDKTKAFPKDLELSVKQFIRDIYYDNINFVNEGEYVYLLVTEHFKDNVQVLCDCLNYIEETDGKANSFLLNYFKEVL